MTQDCPDNSLKLANGVIDNRGRIRGCFGSTTPIEVCICEWPWFPILPPPMKNSGISRKSQDVLPGLGKPTAQ